MKTPFSALEQPLKVVLGSQTIKAFVAAPRAFKVLGIVRMGLEFGLLATDARGVYVRVNGSTVAALDQGAVDAAIALACTTGRGESYAASRQQQLALPTVVVRKRRSIATGSRVLLAR
jgi:hypothetical protein